MIINVWLLVKIKRVKLGIVSKILTLWRHGLTLLDIVSPRCQELLWKSRRSTWSKQIQRIDVWRACRFLYFQSFMAFKGPESMGLVEKQAGKSLSRLNQCENP